MEVTNQMRPDECKGMEDIRREIEKLYTDLVNHFIEEEMKHWKGDR